MNEDDWTNVKSALPKHLEKVLVRLYDKKTEKYHELEAIFRDEELYRSWEFKPPYDGCDITHLPQWWKRYI